MLIKKLWKKIFPYIFLLFRLHINRNTKVSIQEKNSIQIKSLNLSPSLFILTKSPLISLPTVRNRFFPN